MTREQLFRLLKRHCRKGGRLMTIDANLGKGSHARVTVDGKTTTVKAGELTPAYVALLLRQLGLPRDALE